VCIIVPMRGKYCNCRYDLSNIKLKCDKILTFSVHLYDCEVDTMLIIVAPFSVCEKMNIVVHNIIHKNIAFFTSVYTVTNAIERLSSRSKDLINVILENIRFRIIRKISLPDAVCPYDVGHYIVDALFFVILFVPEICVLLVG